MVSIQSITFGKSYIEKNAISDHFACFINCMLLRREHTVLFSISYFLTILLSIPLNKLPCNYSHGLFKLIFFLPYSLVVQTKIY